MTDGTGTDGTGTDGTGTDGTGTDGTGTDGAVAAGAATGTGAAAVRLGRLLAGYRVRTGLTQEQTAERAGMSVRGLRNLELGLVSQPRRRTVDALASAYSLDPADAELLHRHVRVARAESSHLPAAPTSPARRPDMWQVPETDLVGREGQIRAVRDLLATGQAPAVLVDGAAGTGKTALTVHIGHRTRDRFPDGQLYLNLGRQHGTAGVAARLLRQLGVRPEALPHDPDEQLDLYRLTVAGHRLLVVGDGASAAQARLLLANRAPSTGLILTARSTLPSLVGVPRVTVAPLRVDDGVVLLRHLVGHDRVADEPEQAHRIAAFCDGLPLALRIAGARLANHPGRPLAWLAERLAAPERRLDELVVDDLAVRTTLHSHVDELSVPARRLLAHLGRLGAARVSVADVAAASRRSVSDVETLLDELVTGHLVEPANDPGTTFDIRPLTLLFARELGVRRRLCESAAAASW